MDDHRLLTRPLSRPRLQRVVRGLRMRYHHSLRGTAAEIAALEQQIDQLQAEHTQQLADLEQQHRQQRESTTQSWDEVLLAGWDAAEARAYHAVHNTASRQGHLRRGARQSAEQLNASLKQRASELEKAFLRAKDAPIARLNNFRSQNLLLLEQLQSVEQATETVLVQRSLSPPDGPHDEPAAAAPSSSEAALAALQAAIDHAQAASQRLLNHPVARFFESPAWWAVCGLVFLVVALAIGLSGMANWLVAALGGAVSMVAVLLLSLIGMRPWLNKLAAAEYPKFLHAVRTGRRWYEVGNQLAVAENDRELKRLAALRDQQFEAAKQARDQAAEQLVQQLESDIAQLNAQAASEKRSAAAQLDQSLTESDAIYSQRLEQEWHEYNLRRQELTAAHHLHVQQLRQRIEQLQRSGARRLQSAADKAGQLLRSSYHWAADQFPSWERLLADQSWPQSQQQPRLPLGWMQIDLPPSDAATAAGPTESAGDTCQRCPLLFSPLEDGYLTVTVDPALPAASQLVRNVVMRALTGLPAGRTQVWVIDPPGLGRDFGWLMHLGDFDPQWVGHRVWTQPGHISRQLADLALAAEDFIQQALRNQYRDIVEYNREAGALAEPYRLLVWSSFPEGLDDQALKHLRSLLDSGARCGIIPILIIDPHATWPDPELQALLHRRGVHLQYQPTTQHFHLVHEALADIPLQLEEVADEDLSQRIIQAVGQRGLRARRVEVPLESMLPTAQTRWAGDSSQSLEIPIGQSGVGRVHSLKLGIGTAQHAIVAGKTGSGKSSLLHAIITSAALKYSPEQLRLILLDFKKGVEFQVYAECGVPHADIIGIESHREFGLSALEYVDACLQRRGEAFRQAAVQDLASWNARHPAAPMPRMLIVIDEFQELFVEDDKLSSQASLILDRIVRQGRSFGVHALLSSQTLAGAYSLPRTTLGQMAVRIALQCDAADAQTIFADDNPAATRLKFPGQAVYNDAGGRVEGNQPMQIGWLSHAQQRQKLAELPSGYRNQDPTTNRLGRSVVYDGNRPAQWRSEHVERAIAQARAELNPDALWCAVGESVAISPAVVFPLTHQAGRNLLLVGSDDQAAAAVLATLTASFSRSPAAALYVVQGAKPTDAWVLKLPQLWRDLPGGLQATDTRGCDQLLGELSQVLHQRMEATSAAADGVAPSNPSPILLCLLQVGRLRSLRKSDEFDFGSSGDAPAAADKLLEELLRDGPSHGIFTAIWAENYSTVQRWLSRSALRELEIRLLMRMSGSDSTNLIDSIAASRLGDHVMLLYDEATGQEQKFRPFSPEAIGDIIRWGS